MNELIQLLRLCAGKANGRRSSTFTSVIVIAIVLLLPLRIMAQGGKASTGTGGNHMIQGYVFFPSGRRADGSIRIKLQSYNAGEIWVLADTSGAFSFPALAPGNYTVVVDAGGQYEIARESVFIDTDPDFSRAGIRIANVSRRYSVMITLQPKRESGSRVASSVVDATLAEVPEAARELYQNGLKQARAGDFLKAVDSLKAALSLHAKFPLALNELGVQYLKLGQPERAVEPLKKASTLSPDAFLPKLNLGIAYLETMQFTEAEAQLREAVKRNSSAPTAHMYLGVVLVRVNHHSEAQQELELAIRTGGENLALVHRFLGGLYMNAGKNEQAADELEKYLKLAQKASNAEKIRATIRELRMKP